jgi:hypothetical protein
MIDGRRVLFLIAGLAIAPAAFAGMMPASSHDVGVSRSQTDLQCTNALSLFDCSGATGLDFWRGQLLPDTPVEAQQNREIQHPQALTDGTGSLSLCLSALIGLGLCGSVHWVKKASFHFVPEWYHNGGPFQIGHSHAVNPNTLCSVPVYCFIQPVCTAPDIKPQYRLGAIVSLWRKSRCTPTVLGSRAPPDMS